MAGPLVGAFARMVGRAAVSAGRYAVGLARSRGGRVIGGVVIAEKVTRPVRFGYGLSRAYAHTIDSRNGRKAVQKPAKGTNSGKRRRGAFEYVTKY